MRIAIEASLVAAQPTGMGQYVLRLLEQFADMADSDCEFLLMHTGRRWSGPDFGSRFRPVSYFCGKHALAIALRLNAVLTRERADIFHAPANTGAPPHAEIPVLTTVHDIYPLLYPRQCSRAQAFFFRLLFNWTCRSDHFITVSSFTASELTTACGVRPEDITTIHIAPCIANPREIPATVHGGGGGYFLCVGAIDPRKGTFTLLEAYARALAENPGMPKLLFVGPDRGLAAKLREEIKTRNLTESVSWEGFVDDTALARRFAHAEAFLYPSTYEGFGIPLLEAMTYGLPVLCSDIPVFREIGRGYPVYVSPTPEAWADSLTRFLKADYRPHFAEITPAAALAPYSWRTCGTETLACYRRMLSAPQAPTAPLRNPS